jgi:aspartyl-tRNA(Asn)/glutamyl-tRNA(Gln) amidotransferase subunit B
MLKSIFERYPQYEATIGIEVHVQLNTQSKIFCSCPNQVGQKPNQNICPTCAGYPGTLPVLNREVVNKAIRAGLATHSHIAHETTFARKHYFYPDLPKNYQITQDDKPICTNGYVTIYDAQGNEKKIRLSRIHMEEDAGKNIHSPTTNESFVDLNRAGTPLLEIVSYPDISTAQEARDYLKTLRNIVLHLDLGSGNMEDGAFRADTNISVRIRGAQKLGTRIELKNINSFKFIADAIDYEIERQIKVIEEGGRVKQETRLWDTKEKVTVTMRSKEEAADYRYFQEPDLPVLNIDQHYVDSIKQHMPELPDEKFERLTTQCGVSPYEAHILIDDLALAKYFDDAYSHYNSAHIVNWILRNVMGYLKEHKIDVHSFRISPQHLAELVRLIDEGVINIKVAQDVFTECAQSGISPQEIVKNKGLEQIDDDDTLEELVTRIIAENQQQVHAYLHGNERLFGFFVGQAMKASGGKAHPQKLALLFKKHLVA